MIISGFLVMSVLEQIRYIQVITNGPQVQWISVVKLMGLVMKSLQRKTAGKADGGLVSSLVKAALAGGN